MPGRNKASVAVASAGNVQFMATAEVSQQPAVLCTVAGMITFKSVQFFIHQPGQIFLHAGAVKITGQMRADCNAARLMDDRNHFCNRRKIRKAQVIFRRKDAPEKIIYICTQTLILKIRQRLPTAPMRII